MARCYGCGKQGLLLKVRDGFCADCFPKYSKGAQADTAHTPTQAPVCIRPGSAKNDVAKQYLDKVLDRFSCLPMVIDNQVAVYSYPNVYVRNVDYGVLKYMCDNQKFNVMPIVNSDGQIALHYDGAIVGFLNEKEAMCKDWIERGDAIHCEFVSFRPGFECVTVIFYRDEHTRLSSRDSIVTKLTRFSSVGIQDSICCLSDGEKLRCCEDFDSDRICVYNLRNNLIGYLPRQFEEQFEDFAGIFFDHSERSESGDYEIPYVRIYL